MPCHLVLHRPHRGERQTGRHGHGKGAEPGDPSGTGEGSRSTFFFSSHLMEMNTNGYRTGVLEELAITPNQICGRMKWKKGKIWN